MKHFLIEYSSGKEEIIPVKTEKDKDFLILLFTLYAGEITSVRLVPLAKLGEENESR